MIKSIVDRKALLEACLSLDYHVDGTGIEMAFGPYQAPHGLKLPLALQLAVAEITLLRGSPAIGFMVNKIPAGVSSPTHVDPYPGGRKVERWHLPVKTNGACWFDVRYRTYPREGVWFGPVPYWEPHRVGNDSPMSRVHIVVDLDREAEAPFYGV